MRRREFAKLLAVTVSWPMMANAQKSMPLIGWLHGASPGPYAPYVAAFLQGLSETGYVEGRDVAIEYRWAEGRYDRLAELAADLVSRRVDVFITSGTPPALAAKSATATIPIVFNVDDPIRLGLIASLARPGGNLTGIGGINGQLGPKRLELMSELIPQAGTIALLVNPNHPSTERSIIEMQSAARAKGVQLPILKAGTESEIDAAFMTFDQLRAAALIVGSDPFLNSRNNQVLALASSHSVPAIYAWRDFVVSGGLISYGRSLTGTWNLLGIYVGKILKGAKPDDLPVQQPTKFELVVNLKTAKALGLTIPSLILALADQVIE